jgi:hypothetical protein
MRDGVPDLSPLIEFSEEEVIIQISQPCFKETKTTVGKEGRITDSRE